jgi:cyclic beta-1,2-glucan synthetase
MNRQHRWTRGDWQIAHWLRSTVRDARIEQRNYLSHLKLEDILDNLRRSLLAPDHPLLIAS